MKYRQLGKTGFKVSEIGFGAWGIGGLSRGATSYGRTDDNESRVALRRAYECGINFYDTSDIYGYGHSEVLISEALRDVRNKIIIASKAGFLEHNGPYDFSPKHLRKALEMSLKRLQRDYLDLYQLHSPPIELIESNDDILSALKSLKKEGKIRAFGISLRSPDDGFIAIGRGFETIQINFNLLDQRALENGLFAACGKAETGVIIRTPLCFGFLTGRYSKGKPFSSSDHRSTWSREQRERWATAYKLFLDIAGDKKKQSPAQIALRFCLSYKAVSSVIPGMLNKREVEENILASQLGPFSQKELSKIENIYRKNAFFLGKKEV